MELFEKKLNSRQVFDGVVVKLFVDEVELPDGKKSVREIVRHPGAVCVVPVTDNGEVIMVRQFRYAFGEVLLEVPAGKLEKGEDPKEAALRELEEETGTVAQNIEHIGELYTTVAIFDEKIQMYLATGLTYKNAHPDARRSEGQFCKNTVYFVRDMPYSCFFSFYAVLRISSINSINSFSSGMSISPTAVK